jgi:succinyl-diaminopimelate desuccinylase
MDPLTGLLLELCALPCTTGEEGPIADLLADRAAARGDVVVRVGHSVVACAPHDEDDARPTVLLVAHTDVVPPTDADREPRLEPRPEGDVVVGRGTSDMKSGLAVAVDLLEDEAVRRGPHRVVLVAYAGEEGPHEGNELGEVLRAVPGLAAAQLAVVLEPTDLEVQLGCTGTLHAEVVFRGRAAHSARPWQGDNALTAAGAWLAAWRDRAPVDVEVDGLVYREVTTPTAAWTSNARNVVPDAFTVNVNHRFAPDKDLAAAEADLRALVADVAGGGCAPAEVRVLDRAPACPPSREAPLVRALVHALGAPVTPKQAWTDVARLAAVGVPALNYGPGLTAQAHQRGEHVPVANLRAARDALAAFLT